MLHLSAVDLKTKQKQGNHRSGDRQNDLNS
jgi:hypothetical protein